jgi:glycerol uptake facilitator-like aquaporin
LVPYVLLFKHKLLEGSMFGNEKYAKIVAEFLGTAILVSVVLATLSASTTFFTAAAAGLTLAVMVMAIGSISGSHINPAVTVGQWSIKKISTNEAIVYIAAQMLGGLAAWKLHEMLTDQKLVSIAGSDQQFRVFVAEVLGTLVFTFGIAAAIKRGYEGVNAALTIGASLFIGIFVASVASNGVLNPAVAVGIQSWNWAYAIGPLVGGVLGMNLYMMLTDRAVKITKKSTAKTKKSR